MYSKGEVGFLAEDRRINVAVTRARRQLVVVCDSKTVRSHDFLKSLVDYMSEHGEVRTAFEYLDDCVAQNYIRDEKDKRINSKDSGSTKQKSNNQGKKTEQEQTKSANNKSTGVNQSNVQLDQHKNTNSHHPKPKDDDKTQNKKKEIKDQLLNFLKDPNKTELQFPSTLNSHERMLVHEISEEMGLRHESQGEGKKPSHHCVPAPIRTGQVSGARTTRRDCMYSSEATRWVTERTLKASCWSEKPAFGANAPRAGETRGEKAGKTTECETGTGSQCK